MDLQLRARVNRFKNITPFDGWPDENALTRQFTPAERTALKQLKAKLLFAFQIAFPIARTEPVTLWGVQLDPDPDSHDARASVMLMHFLRARDLKVDAALELLLSTLRWRTTFNPSLTPDSDENLNLNSNSNSKSEEDDPEDVFGRTGHIFGRDKQGRPVLYHLPAQGAAELRGMYADPERFVRWKINLMERACSLLDFERVDQIVQVHDYEGFDWKSITPEMRGANAELIRLINTHYPHLTHTQFFLNIPAPTRWSLYLFGPLLFAPKTRSKSNSARDSRSGEKNVVLGLGPEVIGRGMRGYVAEEELPRRYGGRAEVGW